MSFVSSLPLSLRLLLLSCPLHLLCPLRSILPDDLNLEFPGPSSLLSLALVPLSCSVLSHLFCVHVLLFLLHFSPPPVSCYGIIKPPCLVFHSCLVYHFFLCLPLFLLALRSYLFHVLCFNPISVLPFSFPFCLSPVPSSYCGSLPGLLFCFATTSATLPSSLGCSCVLPVSHLKLSSLAAIPCGWPGRGLLCLRLLELHELV